MTYYVAIQNNVVVYCGTDFIVYATNDPKVFRLVSKAGDVLFIDGAISKRTSNVMLQTGLIYSDWLRGRENYSKLNNNVALRDDLKVYQIYYNEQTRREVFSHSIAYNNTGLATPFFENIPIRDIILSKPDCKYISIISWKFRQKTGKNYKFIESCVKDDLSILWANSNTYIVNPIMVAEKAPNQHPGILTLAKAINRKLFNNKLDFNKKHNTGYCNYWIMNIELANKYVNEFLSPCIDLMMNDEEIYQLSNRKTSYSLHNNLPQSKLLELYGQPHVTYHTFFLERMVSIVTDYLGYIVNGNKF